MAADEGLWSEEARRRLREAVKEWGSQAVLAGELGMHKNTLSNILNGDGEPGISRVAAVAGKVGKSLDYILTGRDSHGEDPDLVALPMLTASLAAGAGSSAAGARRQADWVFPRAWLVRHFGHVDGLELLRVVGDSMEPELGDGSWVMVDRKRTQKRDAIYAIRLGDALLVKRVQFQGRVIRLVSDNEAYEPIVIDQADEAADLEIIAPVVWNDKLRVAA